MYSLIISAASDRWDTSPAEFDARRFLEHTAPHLEQAFQLSDATAVQLMRIPTVFAYETGSGTKARVGRVKDLKWSKSTIKFGFEFDPKILPIDLQQFYAASDHLGVERSEPSRTHWAIKDVDLFQALEVAGLLVLSSPRAVSASIAEAIPPSGVPLFSKPPTQYVDMNPRIAPQVLGPSSINPPDMGVPGPADSNAAGFPGLSPHPSAAPPSAMPSSLTPLASSVDKALQSTPGPTAIVPGNKPRVFLVHGRNELLQHQVFMFLTVIGIEVIVLSQQANGGRTIMEKFEREAAGVEFAIVLMTADDVGGLNGDVPELRPRARQNVILELGYFIGKLGRKKVCVMRQDSIEDASDFSGMGYVETDSDWKRGLSRELKEAGIAFNAERAALS